MPTSSRKTSSSRSASDHSPELELPALQWSTDATPTLREAARRQDGADFIRAWQAQFPAKSTAASGAPSGLINWSLFDADDADPVVRLTKKIFPPDHAPSGTRPAIKSSKPLSAESTALVALLAEKAAPWTPLELLIAGELLIPAGRPLDPNQAWSLWSRLATESQRPSSASPQETPDQLLLRAGEAPWMAGLLLPPWREAKALRDAGRRLLAKELFARTDSDGTPHAELLPRMALWLAPLIRATLRAERFGVPLWSEAERLRLTLVLERAIPLCRPNGRLAMSNGFAVPTLPLIGAAVKALSLTGPVEKLWRTLQNPPALKTIHKRAARRVETMPSNQSDWARFAMLRSDWSPHADSLAISHHQPEPILDVAAFGQPILHGNWGWELQIGDAGIEPAEEWSCSCWFSDPDADYLELQMKGPGSLRVERQVLLSRKEHFLLLADCVRGAHSISDESGDTVDRHRIHLRTRLPLAAGVTAEPDTATREIRLKSGRQTVRVFPLALADDRVQSTPHEFRVDRQDLVLHQIGVGNGLYAPLVFDWHPARTRQPALWRTLTVTEAGKVLGRDKAAGHRLQIGKQQWLLYRSLSKLNAARAVLGHHTWHESVIARFDSKGGVDAIMNVDP